MDEQSRQFLDVPVTAQEEEQMRARSGPMSTHLDEQKWDREERKAELPRSEPRPHELPNVAQLADKRPWRLDEASPWVVVDAKGRRIATFDSKTEDGDTRGGINFVNAQHAVDCVNAMNQPPEYLRINTKHDIEFMRAAVSTWADSKLPDRRVDAIMLKFAEEAGELIQDPRSGKEYADVMVTLLDLATKFDINVQHEFWMRMKQLWDVQWCIDEVTGVARRRY